MSGSSYQVLHVDDDALVTRVLDKRLRQYGIQVTSLNDPSQVLELLLRERFQVVLLDVNMPGMNGLDLLDEIKRLDGGINVIMVTGLVSMTTALKSMRCGASACFFKPLQDVEPLVEAIQAEFAKIDRWWDALRELEDRKLQGPGWSAAGSGQRAPCA